MIMLDDEKPRSIRFPERLWNAIDAEARKCKRSSVKQMEAVLSAYYGLANVEIDLEQIETIREVNQINYDFSKLPPMEKIDKAS